MAHHAFYPSPELPTQVQTYVEGLKAHHDVFGDVTGNAPADLKDVGAAAAKLQPLADEVEQLQIDLATKLDRYHKAAAPMWGIFSERLGYARVYAEKTRNAALVSFHDSNGQLVTTEGYPTTHTYWTVAATAMSGYDFQRLNDGMYCGSGSCYLGQQLLAPGGTWAWSDTYQASWTASTVGQGLRAASTTAGAIFTRASPGTDHIYLTVLSNQ